MEDLVLYPAHQEEATASEYASAWLEKFERALQKGQRDALAALFLDDSHWRDLLAFTWNITPVEGTEEIVHRLLSEQPSVQASGFTVASLRTPPRIVQRVGEEVIEAIFSFETSAGSGHGVLRLPITSPYRARSLMTALERLKGVEEPLEEQRPDGDAYSREFGGYNWADRRRQENLYNDRDPTVLIVGAGQSGLSTAARLRLLGVDALCVDSLPRVGDAWRRRYHSLALHNQVSLNHMAHLPFPPSWPRYLAKDMVANWLEVYALAMECNVWTSTTLQSADYDQEADCWRAQLRLQDGSLRELQPRHLVFANGVAGAPKTPCLAGLDEFKGEILHTHWYREGSKWKGKNVLVVGAGNSGHDVAQDLYSYGANVKMIQRGSIMVVNVKTAGLSASVYYDEGLPTEDCDLIASTNTPALLKRGYQLVTKRQLEADEELLAGLRARGFKLDSGPDGAGYQMKTRDKHGGYYLNCGCSDLIVEGKIGLLQFEDIDRFCADGAKMKDGRIEAADLIVMATGYQNQLEVVRNILGEDIAEKIGPVWGIDVDGELKNMYRPTPQPGLWFIGGGLAHARIWSRYLALQIKARELGLLHI